MALTPRLCTLKRAAEKKGLAAKSLFRIETERLLLERCERKDLDEVFGCITPATTRFMAWDPPSFDEFKGRREGTVPADPTKEVGFELRLRDTQEYIGMAAAERLHEEMPEVGICMKQSVHGQGYGLEAMEALHRWASKHSAKDGFLYPVAIENTAGRLIAEGLGGEIIATCWSRKYETVRHRILSLS